MSFLSPESVILVTTSSAGLGAATARAFAAKGVNVVVNYLNNRGKADSLVQELSSLDPRPPSAPQSDGSYVAATPRFIAIQADLSRKPDIIRLVAETLSQMGRLDAVVSNQGWTRMRDFFNLDENVDENDWDTCFNVNVKSHLFLFHAAREHLQKSRGAFVSVASLAGVKPSGSSVVCFHCPPPFRILT
jgi:NAD(P)-dependent dehydrogenase (short-subunit alcohol dehydrogenase family)